MKKFIYLLLIATLGLSSCKKEYITDQNSSKSTSKRVRVATIDNQGAQNSIQATGTLGAKDEVLLSFKTGGIIQTLRVNEGEKVQKNAFLGSLNLSEINAQVRTAKDSYEKASRDYERVSNLYRDTVATLEQKQNAKTNLDIAKSTLEIADFNKKYSLINAPFKGSILKKYVEEGQLVSPGQPVYLIGRSGEKGAQIIKVGITDKDIVTIQLQDTARVVFDAFAKAEYQGIITQIAQKANQDTGLYTIEITLDEYYPELKNGFIGTVQILPSTGIKILKIPMNALVEGTDKSARIFYSLDAKTVLETQVEVIDLKNTYFTVKADALPKNALIISEGAPFLKANDSIKIIQ